MTEETKHQPSIIASHRCEAWELEQDSDKRIFMRVGAGPKTMLDPSDIDSIAHWLAVHNDGGRMGAYIDLANAMAEEHWNGLKQTAARVKLFPGIYAWRPGDEWPCVPCYDPKSPWAHTCKEKKGELVDAYSQDDKVRKAKENPAP